MVERSSKEEVQTGKSR